MAPPVLTSEELLQRVGTFKKGSIQTIKLTNFLTYTNETVIQCGPRLNVVIGANGTGKSSILNAICLGLGGEPKLLGRADDVRAFVAHGYDKGSIEITLAPGTHTIRRELDRQRKTGQFFLNDVPVKAKEVRELVQKEYSIQLDNLCTFLPQDKVGNFSGLDTKALLKATEQSLDPKLLEKHEELCDIQDHLSEGAKAVVTLQAEKELVQRDYDRLGREFERMQERERALEKIELLEKKKLWLQFDEHRVQAMTLRDRKNETAAKAKELQKTLKPLEECLTAAQTKYQESDAQAKTLQRDKSDLSKKMATQASKWETHDDKMEAVLTELNSLGTRRAELEDKLEHEIARVKELEKSLSQAPRSRDEMQAEFAKAKKHYDAVAKELDVAKKDTSRLQRDVTEQENEAKEVQQRLARLNDEGTLRRNKVFQAQPKLRQIYEWLEQNRSKFRRTVWGPIACEITCKNEKAAAFVEQHVPNSLLKSFVVETKEDYDLLYQKVRREMRLPINIVTIEGGRNPVSSHRYYTDDQMDRLKKEHGIQGYLDESITAPAAIMAALIERAKLNQVVVGGVETQNSVDKKGLLQILSEPDPRKDPNRKIASVVCCVDSNGRMNKFTQTVSRYSGKVGTRPDYNIREAQMLAPGVSQRAKEDMENKLAKIHENIRQLQPGLNVANEKRMKCEVEVQNCKARVTSQKDELETLQKFEDKLKRAKQKMKDAEEALQVDDTEEKNQLTKELENRFKHSVNALETWAELQARHHESSLKYAELQFSRNHLLVAVNAARDAYEEKKSEFDSVVAQAEKARAEFSAANQKAKAFLAEARDKAPLEDDDGNHLPLRAQLEEIDVSTSQDCDDAIEEEEKKANAFDANPEVAHQFEQTQAKLQRLTDELNKATSREGEQAAGLQKKKEDWEAQVRGHLDQINTKFGAYMAENRCVGEVRLKTEENVADWGVEIRVSFREGAEAQVLTATEQSGGERSVSTILYLMALQDMMISPFRCVDEINQGLDEPNERLVFRRIVNNSTGAPTGGDLTNHTGQYFLITPKLLPNLEHMAEHAITVLFVFNGPYHSIDNFAIEKLWKADDSNKENGNPRGKKRKSTD